MEVCPGFELIAIEDATALGHDVLELSKRREAQMIRHKRHGSPPRLMALQSILSPNRRESLPTPSAGDRMTDRDRASGNSPSPALGTLLWRAGMVRRPAEVRCAARTSLEALGQGHGEPPAHGGD